MSQRQRAALLLVALLSGAVAGLVAAFLSTGAALVLLTALVAGLLGATAVLVSWILPRLLDQTQKSLELSQEVRRRSNRLDRRSRVMARQLDALAAATVPTDDSVDLTRDQASPAVETLADLVVDGLAPSIVLFLHGFSPDASFAGVRTAVSVAARLADRLAMPLRVLVVRASEASHEECHAALRELVRTELGEEAGLADRLRLSTPARRDPSGHHRDDIWVTTYWSTAHAVGTRVATGAVSAEQVVYLVQDFEPAFHAWGHLYAKALSTYRLGFRLLVNSAPLAGFVAQETGLPIDPRQVLAPALPTAQLGGAAARWKPGDLDQVRVLFYARPSKPRNMFVTGLQALKEWADGLPAGIHAVVRLAGEDFQGNVDLGPRVTVEKRGNLSYDDYFDLLADTDVGLALMLSPHPGHLALELPMAGIPTVTNQFAGRRAAWVDGLIVADADGPSIVRGLTEATHRAAGLTVHESRELTADLGVSTEAAVDHVAQSLRGLAHAPPAS